MIKLVIAEKPSVAKAIAHVLGASKYNDGYLSGNGYAVSHCYGHLAELAQAESYDERYGKWRHEDLPIIPDVWQYAASEDKKKQFDILSKLMNGADVTEIINACDAGREGELIFRTVYNLAGCTKPIKRLWISSMEDKAILKGFKNLRPGSDYDNLYQAALCRSKADWLVGINATRLFSTTYHRTLNVGRVVSPTLAMIVQREAEIKAFKSEPFYKTVLNFDLFKAESERFTDDGAAAELAQECKINDAVVKYVEQKEQIENAPMLYDLTTLQRDANRILGYTAQQTLDYAQSLYEKRVITYPRTDSKYLTDDMKENVSGIADVSAHILDKNAPTAIDTFIVCSSKKVTDHHAIVPTDSAQYTNIAGLLAGEQNILKLIARRTLCAVGEPCVYKEINAVVSCANCEFTAHEKFITHLGWKSYLDVSEPLGGNLAEICEGQILNPSYIAVTEGKTSPPKHFTEDTVLSAMERAGAKDMPDVFSTFASQKPRSACPPVLAVPAERKGIGTPATRANIIEKLVANGFVIRKKGAKNANLIPDNIGTSLITVLPEELQSPLLTAEWEQQLLMIERGELSPNEFMTAIEDMVIALVRGYKPVDGAEILFPSGREVVGKCPRCGSSVTESKSGYFCEKNNCKFGLWRDNRFLTTKKVTLTKKMTEGLLKDGRAYVSGIYFERTGKKYDAYICMADDGTKTTFSLDFNGKDGK